MRQRLLITLRDTDGALQRLLGTAERRGFRICAVHAEMVESAQSHVAITVESARDVALLARQLLRLHEVCDVCVA